MVKTPAKKQSTLLSFFNKTPTNTVGAKSQTEFTDSIRNTGKKRKLDAVIDITEDSKSDGGKRVANDSTRISNGDGHPSNSNGLELELTDEERLWLSREALAAEGLSVRADECSSSNSSTHAGISALSTDTHMPVDTKVSFKNRSSQPQTDNSKLDNTGCRVVGDTSNNQGIKQNGVKVEVAPIEISNTHTKPVDSTIKSEASSTVVASSIANDTTYTKGNNTVSDSAAGAKAAGGVLFVDMSQTFSELEKESGRIKNQFVLIRFIWRVLCESQDELIEAIYLLMGMLAPSYENIALGIGGASLSKIIVDATGANRNTFRALASEHGDMGEAAYRLAPKQRSQMFIVQKKALRISTVHSQLLHLSKISGNKAQSKREGVLRKLFVGCSPVEMKYLVRLCEQNLRVGAAPKTILTCLAYSLYMYFHLNITTEEQYQKYDLNRLRKEADPQNATQSLVSAYSRCPNPRVVLETALRLKGIKDLVNNCPLTPGIPVKPMLGKPVTSINVLMEKLQGEVLSSKFSTEKNIKSEKLEHGVKQAPVFCCETKYDGQRVQVHRLSDGTYRFFSRNLLDNQAWPDLIPLLQQSTAQAQVKADGMVSSEANNIKDEEIDSDDLPSGTHPIGGSARDEGIGRVSTDSSNASTSFIIDAEVVAVRRNEKKPENRAILPFQTLSTRGRNNVEVGRINVQVCLMIFDIMLYDDKALTSNTLLERRRTLERVFDIIPGCVEFTDSIETSSEAEVTAHFRKSVIIGEGLMCKRMTDVYETGERGDSWFKLKKDYIVEADAPAKAEPGTGENGEDGEGLGQSLCGDSLDLVPIAAWKGMGRKAKWYSPYLLAAYDRETGYYHSVCKVMSGFTDEVYKRFHKELTEEALDGKPSDYVVSESFRPTIWLPPTRVWEIRGADLTISPVHTAGQGMVTEDSNRGVSLRFPRFIRERTAEDKSPEDATSTSEVVEMYFAQGQKLDLGVRDDD